MEETVLKYRLATATVVVMLETMEFLVTVNQETLLKAIEEKKDNQRFRDEYTRIHEYLHTTSKQDGEINLYTWSRTNKLHAYCKHLLAFLFEKSLATVYYRPLGVIINNIDAEKYSWTTKNGAATGRKFFYKEQLLLHVQDSFMLS